MRRIRLTSHGLLRVVVSLQLLCLVSTVNCSGAESSADLGFAVTRIRLVVVANCSEICTVDSSGRRGLR
jgi:hypothetical protein